MPSHGTYSISHYQILPLETTKNKGQTMPVSGT